MVSFPEVLKKTVKKEFGTAEKKAVK